MSKPNDHIEQLSPEILRAYHAGELSNAQKHQVEKLMLDDPFYAEALEGLETMSSEQFSADLEQLSTQIDEHSRTSKGFPWYRLTAAVIFLAIVGGVFFFNQEEEPIKRPTERIAPFAAPPAAKQAEEDISPKTNHSIFIDTGVIQKITPQENLNAALKKKKLEEKQSEEALEVDLDLEVAEDAAIVAMEATPENAAEINKVEVNIPMSNFEIEFDSLKNSLKPSLSTTALAKSKLATARSASMVQGRVVGADDNLALPGVNVLIKGTTIGTATDINGRYSLPIQDEENEVLVFRYLGYVTQEITRGERTEINASLEADAVALGEVVVTALGSSSEREKRINAFAHPIDGFQSFNRYLKDNIRYPEAQKGSGKKGRVTVLFDIDTNGQIANLRIAKGMGETFDNEALRLIEEGPAWEPATNERGEFIVSEMKVRIRFKE